MSLARTVQPAYKPTKPDRPAKNSYRKFHLHNPRQGNYLKKKMVRPV